MGILWGNIVVNMIDWIFLVDASTMHVTCGTDIELTCPIRFLKKSEQVVREENDEADLIRPVNCRSPGFDRIPPIHICNLLLLVIFSSRNSLLSVVLISSHPPPRHVY